MTTRILKQELSKFFDSKLVDDLEQFLSFEAMTSLGIEDRVVTMTFQYGNRPDMCNKFNEFSLPRMKEIEKKFDVSITMNIENKTYLDFKNTLHIFQEGSFEGLTVKIEGVKTTMKRKEEIISIDEDKIETVANTKKYESISLSPEELMKKFNQESNSLSSKPWLAIAKKEIEMQQRHMMDAFGYLPQNSTKFHRQTGEIEYMNHPTRNRCIFVFAQTHRDFMEFMRRGEFRGHHRVGNPDVNYVYIEDAGDLRGRYRPDGFIILNNITRQLQDYLYRERFHSIEEYMVRAYNAQLIPPQYDYDERRYRERDIIMGRDPHMPPWGRLEKIKVDPDYIKKFF